MVVTLPLLKRVMPRELLSDEAVDQALSELDWTREEGVLVKRLTLTDFMAAIVYVNRVADLAEALDHHPDITISWNKVTLHLSTHDAGGLTGADLALAKAIDAMAAPLV